METAFQYAKSTEQTFVTIAAQALVAQGFGQASFVSVSGNVSKWLLHGLPVTVTGTRIHSPHFD